MAADHPLITAAELENMASEEHLAAARERVITDWDDAPAGLRERAVATSPPSRIESMAADRPLITAAELDEMTPDERLELHHQRTVTNWDDVPADVRARAAAAPPPQRHANT